MGKNAGRKQNVHNQVTDSGVVFHVPFACETIDIVGGTR